MGGASLEQAHTICLPLLTLTDSTLAWKDPLLSLSPLSAASEITWLEAGHWVGCLGEEREKMGVELKDKEDG